MASPRRFPVFVIALFLVSFSHVVVSADDAELEALIDKICRSLEPGDYGFCNKVFNDNFGPSLPKNMQGLGQIAQVEAFSNATNTHLLVSVLVDEAKPGSPEKIPLDTCRKAYLVVRTLFRTGVDQFGQGQYADALKTERITPRAQGSCSSTFSVPSYPQNPLIEWNSQMRILTAMAIATLTELSR